MNPSREEALLALALMKPAAERAAFLERECGDDAGLRQRIEELLAAHEGLDPFLEPKAAPPGKTTVIIPPEEGPGSLIGRYKILEKIGEGGFGVVYVAEQREPVKRRVALKIIKLGMDTKQVVARFEAERQALALMDHPNIAKVFDAGATESGRPFFVMELVKGISITKYCDQEKLSTRHRLDLFIKVCQAIQHAHQKGVIHRDIKPSNILVTLHDGVPVPKVIDFGIAKATAGSLTEQTLFTRFEQFLGTPAYMSPEQAEVGRRDIDTRSDIYSLGVVLYELLTGRTPFDSKALLEQGIEELILTLREVEPPRPSTRLSTLDPADLETVARSQRCEMAKLVPSLRADLDWIVMKCLDKDRTRRYETANGLARDIERHSNNEPVAARPPSMRYRLHKSFRRNKLVFTSAGVIGLALVLGVLVSSWQAVRAIRAEKTAREKTSIAEAARLRADEAARVADSQREQAEKGEQKAKQSELVASQQAYASDINLAQQALAMNDLGRAKRLLAGHRPRPGEADLRGWEWRYLWRECRSDALGELCRYSNDVFSVAYSPDGKTLAVAGLAQRFVEIWDVPGRRRIATLQTNGGRLVAFSPRGDLLATDATHAGINIWQAGTTNLVRQIAHPGSVNVLKFSPDGARLATLTYQGEVAVWEVDRWAIVRRVQGPPAEYIGEHNGDLDFSPDGKSLVIGDTYGRLRVVDLDTGKTRLNFAAHPEPITAVAWSPKALILASGSGFSGGPIRLWDAESGKRIGVLEGHTSWIPRGLTFSADGRRLYSASGDQTIRIWDVAQQKCLTVLRGSTEDVYGLALSPDGTTLASGSKDGVVAFWSALPESKEEQPKLLPTDRWAEAAFAPDSRVIAVVREGIVRLCELPALRETDTISALGTNVSAVAYSREGTLIVSGSTNGWLRVWSCAERRLLKEFPGSGVAVRRLRFSADCTRLLYGDVQGPGHPDNLTCLDSRTWQQIWSHLVNDYRAASFSPDGRLVVAAIREAPGQLNWWSTVSGKVVATTAGHRYGVSGVAFSPDGALAASVAYDGTVALWNASSFKLVTTFTGHMLARIFHKGIEQRSGEGVRRLDITEPNESTTRRFFYDRL